MNVYLEIAKKARAIFAKRGGAKEVYSTYKGEQICLVASFVLATDPARPWYDVCPTHADRTILAPLFEDMKFEATPTEYSLSEVTPSTYVAAACRFNNTHSKEEILAKLDAYIESKESNIGSVH